MKKLISDSLEDGLLDNIIDMFRHDSGLYLLIGDLLGDERSRVRIGTVALVETLLEDDRDNIITAIPDIARLLKDPNPTIRGDAAHILGIIGHSNALPFLRDILSDDNEAVRESIAEAIDEITG